MSPSMMPRATRRALLLGCVALAACGYRFAVPGAALPKGVGSVHVPVFENRTPEPNVEALVTEAVRERYARAGVLGESGSEATLVGVVLAVSGSPIPTFASVYNVSATVQVTLKRGGEVLGQATVSQAEDFSSGADPVVTEASRSAALRRLADTLAREAVDALAVR